MSALNPRKFIFSLFNLLMLVLIVSSITPSLALTKTIPVIDDNIINSDQLTVSETSELGTSELITLEDYSDQEVSNSSNETLETLTSSNEAVNRPISLQTVEEAGFNISFEAIEETGNSLFDFFRTTIDVITYDSTPFRVALWLFEGSVSQEELPFLPIIPPEYPFSFDPGSIQMFTSYNIDSVLIAEQPFSFLFTAGELESFRYNLVPEKTRLSNFSGDISLVVQIRHNDQFVEQVLTYDFQAIEWEGNNEGLEINSLSSFSIHLTFSNLHILLFNQ